MKLIMGAWLLLLIPFLGTAQKTSFKFGDVPIEELKMTRYDKDSSAVAVVLLDYGESVIEYDQMEGFLLRFERLRRIKILSKEGFDYANFSIPLYHDGGKDEKVLALKGITHNYENGKAVETKLKSDAIFKEKQDENIDFTKVTMPNVKVGSVIELSYSVRSEFIFNFQDWEFQSSIPTVWSEYRARIPEYFNYQRYMQGYVRMDINENTQASAAINIISKERTTGYVGRTDFSNDKINYQENRFRWAAKDIPAFKPEPYITTSRDYLSRINFELASIKYPNQPAQQYMGSWEDINTKFIESPEFGGEIKGNGFLTRMVNEHIAGLTKEEEKISAITAYVKNNVTWNGESRSIPTTSLKKVLEDKKGNSAEINLLLASMLEKANINVSPVLISTRDHGFVREDSPVSSQFNYVICMALAGDKTFLLDATEKLLPVGVLPQRCLNGNGFAVSKAGYKWVKLQSPIKSKTLVNANLNVDQSGELKATLYIERGGFDALVKRKQYLSMDESEYVKDLVDGKSWEVTKSEILNAKDINMPLAENYEVQINEHVMSTPDALYINPFLMNRMDENPFKLENREYPVDYGNAFERIYMCKINLPEGYKIDELPQSKVITLPSGTGRYTYSLNQTGNTLNFISNLQINKSIFSQPEYPNLREFYNQMVAKQAEQIVLKKK